MLTHFFMIQDEVNCLLFSFLFLFFSFLEGGGRGLVWFLLFVYFWFCLVYFCLLLYISVCESRLY